VGPGWPYESGTGMCLQRPLAGQQARQRLTIWMRAKNSQPPVVVGDTFIPLIFPSPLCCILHLCQTLTRNRQGKEREPTVKQVDKLLRQAVPVARGGGVSAVQEKAPPPYRKTAAAAPSRAGHDH